MLRFNSEAEFNLFKSKRVAGGKKRKATSRRQKAKNAGVSVHAIALARLAKNPDLEKGNYEHYLQVRVFDYIERNHPEIYPFLSAYPAGGHRSKKAAAEIQAEGQKKGYPDIILDLPRGTYHGAKLELKTKTGTLQDSQKELLKRFNGVGYYCCAIKGFDDCVERIVDYFNLEAGQSLQHTEFDKNWLNYQEVC